MTVSGTLASLNAALANVVYTPTTGYSGPAVGPSDFLEVALTNGTDHQTGYGSVNLTVNALVTPIVTAPPSVSIAANQIWDFANSSLNISDPSAVGTSDSVTLAVTYGYLTLNSLNGVTFHNGTFNVRSSMSISGTLANLNAALNGLIYTPDAGFTGNDSLAIEVFDSGDNQYALGNVPISVSTLTAPTIKSPASATMTVNTTYTFPGTVSVDDQYASGASDSLTLSVTNGTLTLGSTNGVSFVAGSNGASSLEISGTLASLNAALNGLVYTPNANYTGSDSLHIKVTNPIDDESGSMVVSITVTPRWVTTTNPVPNEDGSGLTLLLTNGDLLVKGGGDNDTNAWYIVKPDSQGNYADGTWTATGNMNVARLFFGSSVLLNGDVFVVGGEYSSDNGGGFSNSAEIYNPNTNVWTQVASDPRPIVGDEPTELLPNGNVLVGDVIDSGTEIYNPSTNTWSPGGTKVHNDQSDEEAWLKLPNGEILTYDIFSSIADNRFEAELYNPSTNTWSDASPPANQGLPLLSTPETGYELGPALLLPSSGLAMFNGTNGNTAFYNYQTNSWTLGPNMPVVNGVQMTTGDAPGAVLPNGNVVLALSPAVQAPPNGEENFPGPTYIYELNPTTGVWTDITPPASTNFYGEYNSFIDDMLILPTGQLWLTDFGSNPLIYTPIGSPQPSWQPTITYLVKNSGNGNQYTLIGTQLNGMDEGASYGDDNQMAENYPIVQVTDTSNGAVYYATTTNWSSVGVQTGTTPESVQVQLPSALGNDPYTLVVIADGIASAPYSSSEGTPTAGVTAPSSAVVAENGSFTFPTNAFALIDPTATGASDSVTLAVSNGTLELGSTLGVSFISGTTGASLMTLSGPLPTLNAAIASLVYTPNANFHGPDTLQITLNDTTDGLSGSASVNITVTTGSSPSLTVPSGVSVNENKTFPFTGGALGVSDPEASGADTLSVSVNNGHLAFGSTSGLTFVFTNNGSSSITVTGTLTSLNADLNTLVYSPNTGFFGPDTLHVNLSDPGDRLSASANAPITVNGPPAISAPQSATLNENGSFTFNGTLGLTDAAVGASDSLTLSVSDGTLALGSTTGLNFGTTSNDSSSITVTGTLTNLNAALNGLVYTPTTGFVGTDLLRMRVQDATDSLSASAGVELAVNVLPPPVIVVPPPVSIDEGKTYTFPQSPTVFFNIIDPAASGTSDTLTLSVADGTLTLGSTTGLTFGGGTANNSSSIIVNGTLGNLQGAISQLVYTPASGFVGTDSVMFSVTDQNDRLTGTASVPITVAATGPIIVVPPGLSYTITQFIDSQVQNVNYVAADNNGNVWFTVQGGIGEVTSTGTLKTFSTSSFQALANPLGITLGTDGNMYFTAAGGNQSAIGEINTTTDQITELPVMTPGTQTVLNPFNFAQGNAITVGPDGNLWFVEPQLGAIGVMSLAGVNLQQIPVAGGVSAGSIAFGPNGHLYIANDVQNANAIIEMTQQGTTVNTTPLPGGQLLSGITDSVVVDNNGTIWFTELGSAIGEATENSSSILTFQTPVSLPYGGIPTDLVLSKTDDSIWYSEFGGTFPGGIGHILANGESVEYPTPGLDDSIALDSSGTPWFTEPLITGSTTEEGIGKLNLPPTSATVQENQSLQFSGNDAIGITDPAGPSASESFSLYVEHGTLNIGTTTGLSVTGSGTSTLFLQGPLSALQADLSSVTYTPGSDYVGPDVLYMTDTDTITKQSTTNNITITVSASTPAITVPPAVTIPNTAYTFPNGAFYIMDAAASGTSDAMTLTVGHGALTLGSTSGLSFGTTSNNSSSITVSGTLANLIAALNGLVYTPTAGFAGTDSLNVSVKDAGDSLTGTASVSLKIATAHTTYVVLDKQPDVTSDQLVPNYESPITPAEMEAAYGITSLNVSLSNLGKGQTIALIDAYNDANIITDANTFSSTYGLPQFNVAGGPTLTVMNENGTTNLSAIPTAAGTGWDVEESLDVEWAHSMAPGANIILFEANSALVSDLLTAEVSAAKTTGVSAISNSWSTSEFSGEHQEDSDFAHAGVTFTASTGDSGPPVGYPAASPNVVAVGGTALYVNAPGAYLGESVWGNEDNDGAGSGGISQFESQPSYQTGKVNGASSQFRTTPDVSLDADPITGVYVVDTLTGSGQVGGTSLSSPMMSGIIAVANAVRVSNQLPLLNSTSPTQTLSLFYSAPENSIFHDISTGISNDVEFGTNFGNGFAAAPGYDIATGLGSPIANNLINYLGGNNLASPPTVRAPIDQTVFENNGNGSVVFDNPISVSDLEPSGTTQEVTLTVDEGTIQLGSTTGITFLGGTANDTSSITIAGTLANLNAAIGDGLTYTPTFAYVGDDYLQISVNDGVDDNTGWGTVNLTDLPGTAPSILGPHYPSFITVNLNQATDIGGLITISDPAASGNSESFSLTVDEGTLKLATTTGLTFTSGTNNSSSMTVTGSLSALQAALGNLISGMVYTPNTNFSGPDWLQLSLTNTFDNLTEPAVVPIEVIGGAPSISAPSNEIVAENNTLTFPGIAISLTDTSASGNSDSLQLSVSDGILNLGSTTGLTFSVAQAARRP